MRIRTFGRLVGKMAIQLVFLQCLGVLIFSSCQNSLPEFQRQPEKINPSPTGRPSLIPTHTSASPFTMNISILDTTGYTPTDKTENLGQLMHNLLSQKPDAVVYTITPEDIEGYSWNDQFFVLTKSATEHLKKSIAQRLESDSGLATKLNIDIVLEFRSFVVFVNKSPIYRGEFASVGGARMVKSPVCYLHEESGQLAFVLRPFHTLAGMSGDYSAAPPDWFGIKDDRIHQALTSAGKLK